MVDFDGGKDALVKVPQARIIQLVPEVEYHLLSVSDHPALELVLLLALFGID